MDDSLPTQLCSMQDKLFSEAVLVLCPEANNPLGPETKLVSLFLFDLYR